ncbi:hypothetical protein ACFQE1_08510 [Halobium palmae]|uniref:DUF7979 domain-containing protein n=1 Tax=Halobium palmae TaxID=1776492 RepID=A0ABD5RZG9_9EURY
MRPSDRIPSKLLESKYVRYEGDVYALSETDTGRNIVEYTLYVDTSDGGEVEESELVIYKNFSREAKERFEEALDNGTSTSRRNALPEKLGQGRFVKYDGDYYSLRVSVGDVRVWRISVTRVE